MLHQWAFFAAVPLGIAMGLAAEEARARVAAAVFAAAVVTMFGASALYHRVTWSPRLRPWMRRLDHTCIYLLIAGTYTPFGLVVLSGPWRIAVLAIVWCGALAAIVLNMFFAAAPKWLAALIGIGLGWVGVVAAPQLVEKAGVTASVLVAAGGLCYTVGAVVYAKGRPDPFPAVFGYHEVFHALVIAAVGLQYAAVALVVVPR